MSVNQHATKQSLAFVTALLFSLSLSGCGDENSTAPVTGDTGGAITEVSSGPEIPSEDICDQEYSVCGFVRVPFDFEGQPRSIAVGLYRDPTPAGSPDVVLTQIDAPSISPGELYPVRVYPFLDTGDFHIWVFIYVEGGGTNRPINGVDYMGRVEMPMSFDGQAIEFDAVDIEPASGW